MNETKLYTLPDIPAAATSNLQLLVRRLIEYADWSLLPALLDELQEQGRVRDVRQLSRLLADTLLSPKISLPYVPFVNQLLGMFLFDLFDAAAVGGAMQKVNFAGRVPYPMATMSSVSGPDYLYNPYGGNG